MAGREPQGAAQTGAGAGFEAEMLKCHPELLTLNILPLIKYKLEDSLFFS
jgi:hypothetical protein